MLRSLGGSVPVVSVADKSVVLIVEEDALRRSADAERLRLAGFEVFEAANSVEADWLLKSIRVDALFLPVRR
jgi:DNA-binding response OmpR family regulator